MYVFTLPLECSPQETDPKNGEAIVDMENEKKELTDSTEPMIKKKPKTDNEEIISHRYEPKKISVFGRFYFSLKMVFWHILLYFAITVSLYAGFHYGFNRLEKQILLDAFSFLYDWRPLVFFLGIYMSFTVKKISDISASMPPTDRLANMVAVAVKKKRVQITIMRYVCSSVAIVFSFLSPMVHKRLTSSEKTIKDKLESESRKIIERIEKKLLNVGSSHFMPLKWTLQVLYEARDTDLVEEKMFNALVSEINHIHAQCDRLVSFKHESFSWGLTICVMCAVYSYFTTGSVRQLWNYLEDTQNYMFLTMALSVNFIVFVSFIIVLRHAEQIVHPYNPDHDVFELNRILNDKLEVASFVLNIKNDLRKEIKNKNLFS